jgi:hypothetical protein
MNVDEMMEDDRDTYLAVEGGCKPDFILSYLLGDLVEGQALPCLCLEKDGVDSWKIGMGGVGLRYNSA